MSGATDIARRVDDLDIELFEHLEAQTGDWDRRALLALHAAAASTYAAFAYLEIGSYLGGSLQAVMRDPRCTSVISIDSRTGPTPDNRARDWIYQDNTTEKMIERMRILPGVEMGKLTTLDASTEDLSASDLPTRPAYCFIDGEHTDGAVLRDAHFCAEALGGNGVIAFHDYGIVQTAITTFLRETWRDISFALAFAGPAHPMGGGGVFALELGNSRMLKTPVVMRAVGSWWHAKTWRLVNIPRRSARPFLWAWTVMPPIDQAIVDLRQRLH